jgi:hypothetical protein
MASWPPICCSTPTPAASTRTSRPRPTASAARCSGTSPNIEDAAADWATISSALCNDDGICYSSGNSGDPRQRHRIGNVTGGKTWWLELSGFDVPPSDDTNYHHGLDERMVHVAVYWEDEARDDADGPTADIQ